MLLYNTSKIPHVSCFKGYFNNNFKARGNILETFLHIMCIAVASISKIIRDDQVFYVGVAWGAVHDANCIHNLLYD